MNITHEFETSVGEELVLDKSSTFHVDDSFVDTDEEGNLTFTHRVTLIGSTNEE